MPESDKQKDEFAVFVQTSSLQRVIAALDRGKRLVYVCGQAGSGKTTLAKTLEQIWKEKSRPVIYVQLSKVRTEHDLYDLLSDQGGSERPGDLIRGSGQAIANSVSDQLTSEPESLLILDGLDEIRDEDAVYRFIRRVNANAQPRIVVTGRGERPDRRIASLFDDFIQIEPFSFADLKDFFARVAPELRLTDRDIEKLSDAGGGSPLAARMLVSLIDGHDLNSIMSQLEQSKLNPALLAGTILDRALDDFADSASAHEVLSALALLETVDVRQLSPSQVDALSALAEKGIVGETGGLVYATHILVRDSYRKKLKAAPDGLDLRSLSFGSEEAERDKLLENTFQDLPGTHDLVAGQKTIVVGDRGVGKSAYFSRLTKSPVEGIGLPTFIPVSSPSNLLKALEADGSPLETAEQFKVGWLTLIACAMANLVKGAADRRLRAAAKDLLILVRKNEGGRRVRTLLDAIFATSIAVKIGPISLSPGLAKGFFRKEVDIHWFIENALSTLRIEDVRPIIAFDRVDEVHKYDRGLQEKALQGLFLAESDLSSSGFPCVLIFVRSDLYEVYDLQEKNKLVSRTLSLRWSRDQLLDFLVARVNASGELPTLSRLLLAFPTLGTPLGIALILPPLVENLPVEDWLWSSLANGNNNINPRQVLLLLVLAAKFEGRRVNADARFSPLFSESALTAAMQQLSELSFKELVDDFRVGRTFLANCRAGRIETLRVTEAETLCAKEDGPTSRQLHQLERLGFLERVLVRGTDGSKQPEFRIPKLFTRGWEAGSTP